MKTKFTIHFLFIILTLQACNAPKSKEVFLQKDTELKTWEPFIEPNGKKGMYFNKEGKKALDVPYRYDEIYPFNGLALVRSGSVYGFIDETGKEVVSCNLDQPHQVLYCEKNPQRLRIQSVSKEQFKNPDKQRFTWKDDFLVYDRNSQEMQSFYCDFPIIPVTKGGPVRLRGNCMENDRNMVRAKETRKWGILDHQLELVVPCEYNRLYKYEEEHFIGQKEGTFELMDYSGKTLETYPYVYLTSIDGFNAFMVMDKEGKMGIIKKNGTPLIPVVMDKIEMQNVRGRFLFVLERMGKKGEANLDGKITIPCEFDEIYEWGLTPSQIFVKKEGSIFSIEEDSITARPVSTDFTDIRILNGTDCLVFKGKKKGLIQNHFLVVQPEFDEVKRLLIGFKKYHYALKKQGKWGIAKKDQKKVVFDLEADSIRSIYGNVHNNFSSSGVKYLPFEEAKPIAFAMLKGKWGLIGGNGKIIGRLDYDKIESLFYNHLFKVQKNGKWGVLNAKGQIVVPIEQSDDFIVQINSLNFESFANNLWQKNMVWKNRPVAFIKKNNKWTLMNSEGALIGKPIYDKIEMALDNYIGLFRVQKNGKWGVINEQGEALIPINEPYRFAILQEPFRSGFLLRFALSEGLECKFIDKESSKEAGGYSYVVSAIIPKERTCNCDIIEELELSYNHLELKEKSFYSGPPAGAQGPVGPNAAQRAKPSTSTGAIPSGQGPVGPSSGRVATVQARPPRTGRGAVVGTSGPRGAYILPQVGLSGQRIPVNYFLAEPISMNDPLLKQSPLIEHIKSNQETNQKRITETYKEVFEEVIFISESLFFVKLKGKWGIFDPQKEWMRVSPKFDNLAMLTSVSTGIVGHKDGGWWILNDCGEMVKPFKIK